MFNVSKQQALNRWDILPMNLREALFSEYNSKILWKICENQHLSEDKIYKVAALISDVIMGFAHPEDLAFEIKSELNINSEIANSIAEEVNRKIFMPIRSEIDKAYMPSAPSSENNNIVDLRQKSHEKHDEKPREKFQEVPNRADAQGEVLAQKSTQKPEEKNEIPIPTIAPKISKETSKIPQITEEKEVPAVEINKIESKSSAATKEAEPLMIHKQEEVRPIFSQKRSLGGLFSFLSRKEKKEEYQPIKAEIEIAYTVPMPPKSKAEPRPTVEKSAIDLQKLNEEKQKILNAQFQAQAPVSKQFSQETIKTSAPIIIKLDEQKNQPTERLIESKPRIVNYSNLTTSVPKIEKPENEEGENSRGNSLTSEFATVEQKTNEQSAQKEFHEIKEKELAAIFQQKESQKESLTQTPRAESLKPSLPPMSQPPKYSPFQSPRAADSLKYETPKIEIIVPEQKPEPKSDFKKEPQVSDPSSSIPVFRQKTAELNMGEISKIEIKTPSIEIKTEKAESENDDVIDLRTFERKRV